MARTLQLKRGAKENLPQLAQAEFGMVTDSGNEELFLGTGTKNMQLPLVSDWSDSIRNLVTPGIYAVGEDNALYYELHNTQLAVVRGLGSNACFQFGMDNTNSKMIARSGRFENNEWVWGKWAQFYSTVNEPDMPVIEMGSYTGTGTYGVNNPCSLTFDKAPRLVVLMSKYCNVKYTNSEYAYGLVDLLSPNYDANGYARGTRLIASVLTETYQVGYGIYLDHGTSSGSFVAGLSTAYAKKSTDGKTLYWYNNLASTQGNVSGVEYHYIAFC